MKALTVTAVRCLTYGFAIAACYFTALAEEPVLETRINQRIAAINDLEDRYKLVLSKLPDVRLLESELREALREEKRDNPKGTDKELQIKRKQDAAISERQALEHQAVDIGESVMLHL